MFSDVGLKQETGNLQYRILHALVVDEPIMLARLVLLQNMRSMALSAVAVECDVFIYSFIRLLVCLVIYLPR